MGSKRATKTVIMPIVVRLMVDTRTVQLRQITPVLEKVTCHSVRGNGVMGSRDDLEVDCDYYNQIDGDGCDLRCETEEGYICNSLNFLNSICKPICGDGLVIAPETCDVRTISDKLRSNFSRDGCSSKCTAEKDTLCVKKTPRRPSICKKCDIKHCLKCNLKDYSICIKCEKSFILRGSTKCYYEENTTIILIKSQNLACKIYYARYIKNKFKFCEIFSNSLQSLCKCSSNVFKFSGNLRSQCRSYSRSVNFKFIIHCSHLVNSESTPALFAVASH
ncbi:unnamed protein product [Moneuplotes crassus]|uniref:Uncharacterized protein n=1 Tax=Euplotes crassus TaxID=5936 RepID=A0AAD1Y3X9_EUPCR|nr:unnamed protein product [Moneuplotes crassus]